MLPPGRDDPNLFRPKNNFTKHSLFAGCVLAAVAWAGLQNRSISACRIGSERGKMRSMQRMSLALREKLGSSRKSSRLSSQKLEFLFANHATRGTSTCPDRVPSKSKLCWIRRCMIWLFHNFSVRSISSALKAQTVPDCPKTLPMEPVPISRREFLNPTAACWCSANDEVVEIPDLVDKRRFKSSWSSSLCSLQSLSSRQRFWSSTASSELRTTGEAWPDFF